MQDVDSKLDYIDGILEYQKIQIQLQKGIGLIVRRKNVLEKKRR